MNPPSTVLARQIVTSLVECGIDWVAYCPGSRDAPLAYALAAAEDAGWLRVATFAEERGAGFWAVGAAKALGTPIAVVTTSGTAVTELHPALEEARYQELPIIAVTADRPFELRGVGASQATEQEGIFGPTVVATDAIPAEGTYPPDLLRQVANRVQRLVAKARSRGPVHLNLAFRDPLVPADLWVPGKKPEPCSLVRFSEAQHPAWDQVVDPHLRTVVVAGDQADPEVVLAAERRSIPILAEPSSGACSARTWIPHAPWLVGALQGRVQQVIVTGRPTLSRPLAELLGRGDLRKVVVAQSENWSDTAGTATLVVQGLSDSGNTDADVDPEWLDLWQRAAATAERAIAAATAKGLNLLTVSRTLWSAVPRPALWLGASNAIRGFDLGADAGGGAQVQANRGLAGIDGTIASAMGYAMAAGQPVRAVMGDLTFVYDLPTLAARPENGAEPDLQLVVLDDGGGSIFASLEHGAPRFAPLYERYFAMAPTIDIVQAAQSCGWKAAEVTSVEQLERELSGPLSGRSLLNVKIPRPAPLLTALREEISVKLGSN